MSAAPKDVLKAASVGGDDKSDVVVLFEEGRYVLDAQGRCDYRYRLVYRVQNQAGASGWATVGTEWAPWYEERPELRARVVTAAGQVHVLDPKTIAEAGVSDDDPDIFSDRRRLRAPLPALQVGSVVEEEIHAPDKAPLFAGGSAFSFTLGGSVPTRRVRVIVDAPEGLPLHHVLRGSDGLTVERERAEGRVRLLVQAGPLAPVPDPEPWMPSDRPRRPYFAFSTGASWGAIAESYGKLVDAQIGVSPLNAPRPGVRREEVAARLLKRLHEEIRYTGVEFGEAALVPQPPGEVLKRKYGDCKDKSALLAGWLRAEGVPAFLALLMAGPGADVDPELPGLGRFNHAIVALPGTPTLWIDATDEFARVGELPVGAQDRLALIAAPGTTALVRTPAGQAGDNTLRKTREIKLAASGLGQLVETTRASGAIERAYRSFYAQAEPKALRESQENYAKAEHQAVVVAARNANPRDLTVPFELRVESKDSGRAATDGSTAVVTIAPAGLFSRLPDVVTSSDEGAAPTPRRQPFVLAEPHRLEWNYRIVPPPGFVVKRLPDTEKAALGPASLEVRFASKADGTVEGRLAFDSGPRLVEAKALDEMRTAIARWRDRAPLRVEFEEKAQALAESGRTCEALGELRRAADLEAKKAGPRARLAEMLLQAGFGEAARDEARRAVALEPSSSSAHRILGWTLEHDALGRRFKPGFDRAGAEAEYKKAKDLDPRDVVARASLAILYEYDAEGVHYGEKANLEAAVREVEALRADLKSSGLDVNLMISLFRTRRFAELEKLARSLPDDPGRNEFVVAAVGAQRGAKAAIAEATKLFPDQAQRRDALLHAGNSLIEQRLYPAGSALVAESAAGASDASVRRARADLFARVKRYDELDLSANEPTAVVRRLFAAIADQMAETVPPRALFDVIVASAEDQRALLRDPDAFRRDLVKGMRQVAGGEAFSRGAVDIVVSLADLAADGDPDTGYRVRLRLGDRSQSMYVVRRDGRYRVLASIATPPLMAEEAWRLVDGGHVEAAAQWLDWLREEFGPVSDDDPLAGPPFLRLWRPGRPRGENAVRVATASLFAAAPRLTQGIQMLNVWRDAQPAGAARRDVDFALMALYTRADRPADRLKLAESLALAYPDSTVAFSSRVDALIDLGRRTEARAAAEERLRKKSDDQSALRWLATLASQEGRYEDAERVFAQMAKLGRIEEPDLNNRAWNAVLLGKLDDSVMEWAQQAAQAKGASSATLHTLATVYAEKGRVKEAQQLLAQSVAASPGNQPRAQDWYVVGRLAEQCGLTEVARGAYGRTEDKSARLDSPAVLSRKGLSRLGAASRPTRKASR